jgi:hypothetical protein
MISTLQIERTPNSARPVNQSDKNELALEILAALIVKRLTLGGAYP